MEPENDGFQLRNLRFKGLIFRWTMFNFKGVDHPIPLPKNIPPPPKKKNDQLTMENTPTTNIFYFHPYYTWVDDPIWLILVFFKRVETTN